MHTYLQMWRTEAFEHTLTFSDFESYLVANLDEMIRGTLRWKVEKRKGVARQELFLDRMKVSVMTEDNRGWWLNHKVAAITEARRQQEEQQDE